MKWVDKVEDFTEGNVETNHEFDIPRVMVGDVWIPLVPAAKHDALVVKVINLEQRLDELERLLEIGRTSHGSH